MVWWWIEPLMCTGFIAFIPAVLICVLADSDNKTAFVVACLFSAPLLVSVLAAVINSIWVVMCGIWGPYL